MSPTPLYNTSTTDAAFKLRYSWAAWASEASFPADFSQLFEAVHEPWETDGLRVLEHRHSTSFLQILFSALPSVSPQFLATRAKGRLDHAAREAGAAIRFTRSLAVRSVGDNTREDIEGYIARQVDKEQFADPHYRQVMKQFTVDDQTIDLSQPEQSARGRYWYNLHLVLVVEGRSQLHDPQRLGQIRDATLAIGAKKGHRISALAVMPDHLHVALRPLVVESPREVAFCYQNNLAYMLRLGRLWADSYYVGTFGEYTTHAVRMKAKRVDE